MFLPRTPDGRIALPAPASQADQSVTTTGPGHASPTEQHPRALTVGSLRELLNAAGWRGGPIQFWVAPEPGGVNPARLYALEDQLRSFTETIRAEIWAPHPGTQPRVENGALRNTSASSDDGASHWLSYTPQPRGDEPQITPPTWLAPHDDGSLRPTDNTVVRWPGGMGMMTLDACLAALPDLQRMAAQRQDPGVFDVVLPQGPGGTGALTGGGTPRAIARNLEAALRRGGWRATNRRVDLRIWVPASLSDTEVSILGNLANTHRMEILVPAEGSLPAGDGQPRLVTASGRPGTWRTLGRLGDRGASRWHSVDGVARRRTDPAVVRMPGGLSMLQPDGRGHAPRPENVPTLPDRFEIRGSTVGVNDGAAALLVGRFDGTSHHLHAADVPDFLRENGWQDGQPLVIASNNLTTRARAFWAQVGAVARTHVFAPPPGASLPTGTLAGISYLAPTRKNRSPHWEALYSSDGSEPPLVTDGLGRLWAPETVVWLPLADFGLASPTQALLDEHPLRDPDLPYPDSVFVLDLPVLPDGRLGVTFPDGSIRPLLPNLTSELITKIRDTPARWGEEPAQPGEQTPKVDMVMLWSAPPAPPAAPALGTGAGDWARQFRSSRSPRGDAARQAAAAFDRDVKALANALRLPIARIATGADPFSYRFVPGSDAKVDDRQLRLHRADIEAGEITLVTPSGAAEIPTYIQVGENSVLTEVTRSVKNGPRAYNNGSYMFGTRANSNTAHDELMIWQNPLDWPADLPVLVVHVNAEERKLSWRIDSYAGISVKEIVAVLQADALTEAQARQLDDIERANFRQLGGPAPLTAPAPARPPVALKPYRLVSSRPLTPDSQTVLENLAREISVELGGLPIYVGQNATPAGHLQDIRADDWIPVTAPPLGTTPQIDYVRDSTTGLLVSIGDNLDTDRDLDDPWNQLGAPFGDVITEIHTDEHGPYALNLAPPRPDQPDRFPAPQRIPGAFQVTLWGGLNTATVHLRGNKTGTVTIPPTALATLIQQHLPTTNAPTSITLVTPHPLLQSSLHPAALPNILAAELNLPIHLRPDENTPIDQWPRAATPPDLPHLTDTHGNPLALNLTDPTTTPPLTDAPPHVAAALQENRHVVIVGSTPDGRMTVLHNGTPTPTTPYVIARQITQATHRNPTTTPPLTTLEFWIRTPDQTQAGTRPDTGYHERITRFQQEVRNHLGGDHRTNTHNTTDPAPEYPVNSTQPINNISLHDSTPPSYDQATENTGTTEIAEPERSPQPHQRLPDDVTLAPSDGQPSPSFDPSLPASAQEQNGARRPDTADPLLIEPAPLPMETESSLPAGTSTPPTEPGQPRSQAQTDVLRWVRRALEGHPAAEHITDQEILAALHAVRQKLEHRAKLDDALVPFVIAQLLGLDPPIGRGGDPTAVQGTTSPAPEGVPSEKPSTSAIRSGSVSSGSTLKAPTGPRRGSSPVLQRGSSAIPQPGDGLHASRWTWRSRLSRSSTAASSQTELGSNAPTKNRMNGRVIDGPPGVRFVIREVGTQGDRLLDAIHSSMRQQLRGGQSAYPSIGALRGELAGRLRAQPPPAGASDVAPMLVNALSDNAVEVLLRSAAPAAEPTAPTADPTADQTSGPQPDPGGSQSTLSDSSVQLEARARLADWLRADPRARFPLLQPWLPVPMRGLISHVWAALTEHGRLPYRSELVAAALEDPALATTPLYAEVPAAIAEVSEVEIQVLHRHGAPVPLGPITTAAGGPRPTARRQSLIPGQPTGRPVVYVALHDGAYLALHPRVVGRSAPRMIRSADPSIPTIVISAPTDGTADPAEQGRTGAPTMDEAAGGDHTGRNGQNAQNTLAPPPDTASARASASPRDIPAPPPRLAENGRLSAADTVISLYPGEMAVYRWIEGQLKMTLGAAWTEIQPDVLNFARASVVRGRLAGMTRGDQRKLVINQRGWRGTIVLDARVRDFHHVRDVPKFEFEAGAESQAAGGDLHDHRWRWQLSLPLRLVRPDLVWVGIFGRSWDRLRGQVETTASRSVAKTKIVEPAAIYDGVADIRVRIDLRAGAARRLAGVLPGIAGRQINPPPRTFEIGTRVATPLAESPDTDGGPPPPTRHFAPPERVTRDHRLGSTDVVLDVHPNLPPGTRTMRDTRGFAGVVDGLDGPGRTVYGDRWPRVKAEILGEVDLDRIQQHLKGMMSGQPLTVLLESVNEHLEITAKLTELAHQRATGQAEFNAGTETHQSTSEQHLVGDALQLPAGGQFIGTIDNVADLTGTGTAQVGRDTFAVRDQITKAGMATRTKAADGQKFGGQVRLTFAMRDLQVVGATRSADPTADLAIEALIETAEARPVDRPTPWSADPPPTLPDPIAPDPAVSDGTAAAPRDVLLPPERIWGGRPGTGMRDTDTVRDLYRMDRVRAALDQEGRRFFGEQSWSQIRQDVLSWFDRDRLMSGLPSMTRGAVMDGPELNQRVVPPGSFIQARASLTSAAFRRITPTELYSQADVTNQISRRRLNWWSQQTTAVPGGIAAWPGGEGTFGGFGGAEYRRRIGWRTLRSGKVVAGAKFPTRVGIYDNDVEFTFTFGAAAKNDATAQATAKAETTIPQGEGLLFTGSTRPPALLTPANHQAEVAAYQAEQTAEDPKAAVVHPSGRLIEPPRATASGIHPPARLADEHRISSSDTVLRLGDDDHAVMREISRVVRPLVGYRWRTNERRLNRRFGGDPLRAKLPSLSAGESVTTRVGGLLVRGKVTVTAEVGDLGYRETVPGVDAETGTETAQTAGGAVDSRIRLLLQLPQRLRLSVPFLRINATAYYSHDTSTSHTGHGGGRAVARAKTVEDGALFTGPVRFVVNYELRRLGFRLHRPPGTIELPDTGVIFPLRDTRVAGPDGRPRDRTPDKAFTAPARMIDSRRLGSSDVVQDLRGNPARPGDRLRGMDDILRDVEPAGREMFGRRWDAVQERITTEVPLNRLQYEFRAMTAGDPIEIQVPGGRVSITASVPATNGGLPHVSNTAQTEFHTGTEQTSTLATTDGITAFGRSNAAGVTVQVQGTTDSSGVDPVRGRVGGAVSVSAGGDDVVTVSVSTRTAVSTKTRQPGAVFDGPVLLHFRLERTPLIGADRIRISDANARLQVLTEQSEATPRPPAPSPQGRRPDAPIPPTRIWSDLEDRGLRDTDVVRSLPDTTGLHRALDVYGPRVFGASSWAKIGDVVKATFSNANLSASLPGMTRGEPLTTPRLLNSTFSPDTTASATAEILHLRHLRSDDKAELNPVNETTTQTTQQRQYWSQGGVAAQAGVEADLAADLEGSVEVSGGGAYRGRSADIIGSTGRVLGNGKFASPTANFEGFAKISIELKADGRTETITGVVPVELGFPVDELAVMLNPLISTTFELPGEDGTPVQWYGPRGMDLPLPKPEPTPQGTPGPAHLPEITLPDRSFSGDFSDAISGLPFAEPSSTPQPRNTPQPEKTPTPLTTPTPKPAEPTTPTAKVTPQLETTSPDPISGAPAEAAVRPAPVTSESTPGRPAHWSGPGEVTVGSRVFRQQQVPNDGRCFFEALLQSTRSQNPGTMLDGMSVADLANLVHARFMGLAGASLRADLDARGSAWYGDITAELLRPLTRPQLANVIGRSAILTRESDDELRTRAAEEVHRRHFGPAWTRLLTVSGLTSQRGTRISDLVAQAIRSPRLWESAIFDRVPEITLNLLDIDVVLVRPTHPGIWTSPLQAYEVGANSGLPAHSPVHLLFNGHNHYETLLITTAGSPPQTEAQSIPVSSTDQNTTTPTS
ncbi:hypothetical protein [Parafrankia sp. EUN1f]|uniref:hypothetical protein n=1 Tax=Parafrankia sp. EUN1f TaxID=102897 RepID=UPI0012FA181E|nr:hypothetical protein [Parafrankia sp. EUN1f]